MKRSKPFAATLLTLTMLFVTATSASAIELQGESEKAEEASAEQIMPRYGWPESTHQYQYEVSGTDSADSAAYSNYIGDNTHLWVFAHEVKFKPKVVHRTILQNSNHEARSNTLLTYEGTNNRTSTWATKNYEYHINVSRHYDDDGYMTLTGDWGMDYIY